MVGKMICPDSHDFAHHDFAHDHFASRTCAPAHLSASLRLRVRLVSFFACASSLCWS
jgi:hypothetical protein